MEPVWPFTQHLFFKIRHWLVDHLPSSPRSTSLSDKISSTPPPLRAELLSSDQMEQHGARLAASHHLLPGRMPDRLLARLSENQQILIETSKHLMVTVTARERITPAGEWLLDNFYLVEEQIHTARRHLPKGYSRELPLLGAGNSASLPRIFDLALEVIAHGDGRIHPDSLNRFIAAYQTVKPLRLGELWAIPIMLRLALIENLRRVAEHIAADSAECELARVWSKRLTKVARKSPKNLILVIADMARSTPPMSAPFVSELARSLQGQGPALAMPLTWIEQQLAEAALSIEQLVRIGNQRQAADQVSIANSIGSLRLLGSLDWRAFVESMSLVDHTLSTDPAGAYRQMDFASRDRYRHVIEALAKSSHLPEQTLAQRAVDLAAAASTTHGKSDRLAHVGYYLIDDGLGQLEDGAFQRLPLLRRLKRLARRAGLSLYLGAIGLISIGLTTALLWQARQQGLAGWELLPLGIILLFASSQLAGTLVNWVVTLRLAPRALPRLDFSAGIPQSSRTLVVVPTMLTGKQEIHHLAEALEVRFLANRDAHLQFALLTDFADAQSETEPADVELLACASQHIDALNTQYATGQNDVFFLLHRARRWNAQENIWMGYERKRGKLADLNLLLRKRQRDGFTRVVGNVARLDGVKYVITLDTDTELPRDAARQLVGTMAHPLNRPVYNTALGRVTAGYGILQPRVSVSLPGSRQSRYAQLHSGESGIDPYTRAVSDVYQDAFGEGSFIGKGIYDVEAFEQALGGRFPDNRILSHDLLEGCYARAGLLSDVQLFEHYPARYAADVKRRHRWIRGDWQLAGWLLPKVPAPMGERLKNSLSPLSRWKLFDNLRRSLVSTALTVLLLLGWTVLNAPVFWTLMVIAFLVVPGLLASVLACFRKPTELGFGQHFTAVGFAFKQHLLQTGFELLMLPHEAFYSLDAIARTLWRLAISKRNLLEWCPSGEADRPADSDLTASFRSMVFAPALAAFTAVALLVMTPSALAIAAPILLLWLASPLLGWWLGRPLRQREARLSEDDRRYLGRMARKTWAFFETFVGPDDHWLPPDNYQASREEAVAHRTSPTNMGLALLANLSAWDFGYIPTGQVIERSRQTLATMAGLERHRGHFLNWYDTQTLQPLHPSYVSSVDSGNLAGHLLTLRPGLLALLDAPLLPPCWLQGLQDTFAVVEAESGKDELSSLSQLSKLLLSARSTPPDSLTTSYQLLGQLQQSADQLSTEQQHARHADMGWWSLALLRQCQTLLDELDHLAPWLAADATIAGMLPEFERAPTLRNLAGVAFLLDETPTQTGVHALIRLGSERAQERVTALQQLARQAGELAVMEFDFLYDKQARLLSIGYNVDERRRDDSCYDLLASEARLTVFIGIAQGQLPEESWFALGRLLTSAGGEPILLSWSGSMFEYLMPQLVMPNYADTLLDQTARAAVTRQIQYGQQRDVPWGISESGYNTMDVQLNYQYRAFGVPGLGLKRGLIEDLVVAPYAAALALMVAPEAACSNLKRLSAAGAEGRFGWHEAIDYTPARQRRGETQTLINSYMAHHQGMALLALDWLLAEQPMQKRFVADPQLQATVLLLQERIPRTASFYIHTAEVNAIESGAHTPQMPIRVLTTPHTPVPEVQLLSNGRYHVMVTNAGGGYSRWKDLAVTRWREDGTRDHWGTFCYVRDLRAKGISHAWSNAYHPTLKSGTGYEAIFSEGRAEFRRHDGDFDTHTEIVVSPEDDIELRRVHITNRSRKRRTLEITSYAEVVLAPAAADNLHPAFSNLFVQTEILPDQRAILCTRRPRSRDEPTPYLFHQMAVHDAQRNQFSYETTRENFIGRGNTVASPKAMEINAELSGSEGSVLDPVTVIRAHLILESDQTVSVDLVWGVTDNREAALDLIEKYQDQRLADRVFELAWTHAQVVLRQINATETDAQLYSRLANSILFADAGLRADSSILKRNHRGQSGLWGYAISGDLPIVLLRIGDLANIELVRQLIQAHAYWRLKGLAVDLVIWNEDRAGYRQVMQDQIMGLIAVGLESQFIDRPGGIFLRSAEHISEEDRILFKTVARVILSDSNGTLAEQMNRPRPLRTHAPRLVPTQHRRHDAPAALARNLILDNGTGGFTPDGREYVITSDASQRTPAPWVNVLSNAHFGSVISESGQAYSWGENAHEFRLTPWHNDPVTDASGEAFYLRDEETGQFWSPTPLPCRGATPYVSRHGLGYSVFEHTEAGIFSELWVFVSVDSAVKYSMLKVRNLSGQSRRLSATGYVEWVLGDLSPKSAMHVTTELDPFSGILSARNPYNSDFEGRVAFFDVDETKRSISCDRTEFIGRNGSLASPAAMSRTHLSGRVGSGLDPCAAIQVPLTLAPGGERQITFRLGMGGIPGGESANDLAQRLRGRHNDQMALEAVWQQWNHTLGAVQIETPDESLNVLCNGWLLYQTLASRIWARSGYYQSGGAFGFRDQLQDAMALVHTEPGELRKQILLCASRQFAEGDVQHWWHPPSGRGVRTHCSDDYLWLPLATARYVSSIGDTGVLDEEIQWLDGRLLKAEDESYYDLPTCSDTSVSLYEHCAQAIRHALASQGEHGLPLMGSGDWNDGMNRVGIDGKGESVWLGFFLCDVLRQFASVAHLRGDTAFADECDAEGARLAYNLDHHGWDGGWYRRAWFDDGSPLGSAGNSECRIDSISQSWAVLSGAGRAERVRSAMDSVSEHLVRREDGLVQLLNPPFDQSALDPGYIKGYVPGVRENGGQYTHSAVWAAMAFASLGDTERAWEITSMINPANHGNSAKAIAVYKVEPYVMAADVYAVAPHTGRGGWTWYTGSAGWMYRLVIESLLGLRLEVDKLHITPHLPAHWNGIKIHYRYRETVYHIDVEQRPAETNDSNPISVVLDGVEQLGTLIPLADDRQSHRVEVLLQIEEGK